MSDKPRAYLTRDHKEFMAVIGQARTELGLTRQAVSLQLGLSRCQAARWFKGDNLPDTPTLWDLAHALGYDIALIPRQPKEQP